MQTRSEPVRKNPSAIKRARALHRSVAERDPIIGVRVLRLMRRVRTRVRRARLRIACVPGLSALISKPKDHLLVAPQSILHCSLSEFALSDFRDEVVPGDWDVSEKRFADLDIYAALASVLKDKTMRWSETEWFKTMANRIRSGAMPYGCPSETSLETRLDSVEALFTRIRDDGYKSQSRLIEEGSDLATGDEVAVAIGRTGELLFCDGAHRLCIALLLGRRCHSGAGRGPPPAVALVPRGAAQIRGERGWATVPTWSAPRPRADSQRARMRGPLEADS